MDKNEDSSIMGGIEVRLEQRILFRLDLPNRKTVCVKAKPNKITLDVLKPILLKYGYKLDLMFVHKVIITAYYLVFIWSVKSNC